MGRLDDVDLSLKLSRKEQDRLLALHGARLAQLRLDARRAHRLRASSGRRCACSSRAGTPAARAAPSSAWSRRSTPATSASSQFAAPSPDEKRHHYLHRFVPALPGWGGMAVLDRTWYGRVLVERVEGFATEEQWRRAYREIDDFERMLADDGMIIVKLFLHISEAEQLKRFERRREDPLKTWKLTDEDWRNREKRPAYEAALEEMFERTDTEQRAVADRPGRLQALRARARHAGGHRRHRGGLRAPATSRCPRRSSRSTD